MNMNNMKMDANASMSSRMAAGAMTTSGNNNNNNNNAIIKNITEYQTAQSLAAKAQEVFNKNLKPISQPNAASASNQIKILTN